MTPSHHQQTMTYGSSKQAKAHREVEHQRIEGVMSLMSS